MLAQLLKTHRRATSAMSYALLLGLLAAFAIVAVIRVGDSTRGLMTNVGNRLANVSGAAPAVAEPPPPPPPGYTVVGTGTCERGAGTRTVFSAIPSVASCAATCQGNGDTVFNRRADNVCVCFDATVSNMTSFNCTDTWTYGTIP